jgi:DNA-binding NtrC family response regulator
MTKIIIIGRQQQIVDAAKRELSSAELEVHGAISISELQNAMQQNSYEYAFMGPGLPLDMRLDMIRAIFENSDTTSVHMKDFSRGPEGALDFVRGIISGLEEAYRNSKP